MEKLLTKSGTKAIGDIPRDAHFRLFYCTGEETEAILAPYFQTAYSLETCDAPEVLDSAK